MCWANAWNKALPEFEPANEAAGNRFVGKGVDSVCVNSLKLLLVYLKYSLYLPPIIDTCS